ncbi:MAG: Coenzyme F420 hydrogenase/dehydrogenase, beta subunit C-terminal domain [Oscillospiraceae bacterium]
MNTKAVACYNKDDKIRMKSSSGGVFYLLAKYVIENGGVVFGAKFNKDWEVIHSYAETLDGISDFMGSKYVQSSMGNTYKDVLQFLKQDRLVLFSGTPCQVYGLKAFLGKDYDNLITIDLICHGVPSRKVWREYIRYISGKKDIANINFRDKTEGWLDFSLKFDFSDNSSYIKNQHNDLYMKGFLQDIYLRPSCYKCRFKGISRESDLTLADFWGCKDIMPDMFDDKGTSLVLIQSDKGNKIWDSIQNDINMNEITDERYQTRNPNIKSSVKKNYKRAKFYKDDSFDNLTRLTKPAGPIRKFMSKCKHIIKKVIKK